MSHRIYLNYPNIVQNHASILNALFEKSDSFSLSPIVDKPYSQRPPVYSCAKQLNLFATQFVFEKSDWPHDFISPIKHQILVYYECNNKSKNVLLQMPNIFLAVEYDLPEDICFYRNGKLWFATITHEQIAFLENVSEQEAFDFSNMLFDS